MALAKAVGTLVSNTTITSGVSTYGTPLDLRTAYGGIVTMKISNGGTNLTSQCVCNVLIAHTTNTTPTGGAAGSDWKTIYSFGGGLNSNTVTEQSIILDASVMHAEVTFSGHNQQVTVEAYMSEITSY